MPRPPIRRSICSIPRLRQKLLVLIALLLITTWAIATRIYLLFSSPYPMGVDGYFYAIEMRSLIAGDGLYYGSLPAGLYLMLPFAFVGGPIAGAKIAAATWIGSASVPVYLLLASRHKEKAGAIVAAAFVAGSAQSHFLSAEFVKCGIGMTLAAWALWAAQRAVQSPSIKRLAVVALCAVLIAFTHWLPLTFLIIYLLALIVSNRSAMSRWTFVGLAALASVPIFLSQPWSLLSQLFTLDPSLAAIRFPNRSVYIGGEVALSLTLGCAALALIIRRWRREKTLAPLLVASALLCLFLSFPWLRIDNAEALGFRLRVCAWLPAAICLGAITTSITNRWITNFRVRIASIAIICIVWLAALPGLRGSRNARVTTTPTIVEAIKRSDDLIGNDWSVASPSRQLMFMFTWYTKRPARMTPKESGRWQVIVPRAWLNGNQVADLRRRQRRAHIQEIIVDDQSVLFVVDARVIDAPKLGKAR